MRILPIAGYQTQNQQNFGMFRVKPKCISDVQNKTGATMYKYVWKDSEHRYARVLFMSLDEFRSLDLADNLKAQYLSAPIMTIKDAKTLPGEKLIEKYSIKN